MLLCFLFIVCASGVSIPQKAQADDGGYMFDRVIEWADGSTEHIQIGDDGFFVLDGVKRRLVGMFLYTVEMPYGEPNTVQFWLPENLAVYDRVLTYLESVGVRFIHIDMRYCLWWLPSKPQETGLLDSAVEEEREAYKALLDLVYQHKMLLVPGVFGKWNTVEFDISPTPDFSFQVNDQTDTMSAWAERWIDAFCQYPNVVGVVAEQELDCPLGIEFVDPPQEYTAADVENYMNFLLDMIRPKIDVPIVHNLMGDMDLEENIIDIKRVCLNMTDHPVFNFHYNSPGELGNKLGDITSWLAQERYPTTGWWCFELSKSYPPDNANFTVEYIETVFDHGASLVTLFEANNEHPKYNGWAFFDANGDPKPQMVKVAQDIERLQAPIPEAQTVARR